MATYKGIKGFKVQSLASDPTLVEGQVWYNTTGNVLKYQISTAGAWASGGRMIRNGVGWSGSFGTQTAAINATGYDAPVPPVGVGCEEYDGTSWSEVNNVNLERYGLAGAGTLTAGIIFGGSSPLSGSTETYNGTTWTEVSALVVARGYINGSTAGSTTAALCIGGSPTGGNGVLNESWNGTSWTEVGDLNTPRRSGGSGGTQTDAIMATGSDSPTCELWDGSSWTEVADVNNVRTYASGCGATSALAIIYGGRPPNSGQTVTEQWDGTSWTEVAAMATTTFGRSSIGTSTLALAGGGVGQLAGATEEWNGAPLVVKTVTTS